MMFKKLLKIWSGERLETFIYNEIAVEHLHRYAIATTLAAGKNVLDIACGEGFGANLLAAGAAHITAVDIDAKVIQKARKKYRSAAIDFLVGNAEKIPCPDASFDLVVSFETIEHLDNQDKMLTEIKRVLKPDGILLISTPNKDLHTGDPHQQNPFHKKELSKDELKDLLRNNFTHISIYDQYPGYNSFITNETDYNWEIYSGNFNKLKTNKINGASYYLAIAGNITLPEIKNSFFNPSELISAGIKENITYKIGSVFTFPIKLILKVFK
jgi:ubiquinone/menaquinone biosynthesis C-methylase UbiE